MTTLLTTVVCVKVDSIRPQYENLAEWCKDPNNAYIGRKGVVFINKERYPKQDSLFANPYKVGKDGDREQVLAKYRVYLERCFLNGVISVKHLLALKGKNLGCWCKPDKCHGDILVELIEKYSKQ